MSADLQPDLATGAVASAKVEKSAGNPKLAAAGRWLLALAFGAVVVVIVEWLVDIGVIGSLIMPKPSAVWARFSTIVESIVTGGPYLPYFATTAVTVFLGFAICLVIGIVVGVLVSQVPIFRTLVYPYILAFNASPRVIFAPMFVIWFGIGIMSRLVMAVAIGTFPVLVNTIAGLARADATTLKLMSASGATPWQRFRYVSFPSALPFIVAGAETASVLTTVGVIIGEFQAGNDGLGYLVLVAQGNFDLPGVFAGVLLVALLGIVLNAIVHVLGRRLVFWGRTR